MIVSQKENTSSFSLLHKMRKKSMYVPLKTCKQFMFFLNITETEFEKVMDFIIRLKKESKEKSKINRSLQVLTVKEKEIFEMVVHGYTTKEIANKLFVQASTISTHRKNIKQKLNFKNSYDWFNFYEELKVV